MYGKNGGEDREAVYKENVAKITEMNAEGAATFDVNEHADLTVEEWRAARGISAWKQERQGLGVEPYDGAPGQCNFDSAAAGSLLSPQEVRDLADGDDIDWDVNGAVTPVKDQGAYGTCGYFSTIAVVESINVIQGGNDLVSLSEQENIDCCTPGFGGCMGWPGQELAWYANEGVFAKTEASYPYTGSFAIPAKDGTTCRSSSGEATVATTSSVTCVALDPDTIKAHLIASGPAVWMIDATCLQLYSSGILNQARCAGSGGGWPSYDGIDHATTLVGSGVENGVAYWRVKNSWGRSWGESGYYRVVRDEAGSSTPMLHAIGGAFASFPSSSGVSV